jgi:hypothetical protein
MAFIFPSAPKAIENDEGEFVYARDMSIAYPIMEELCFAIAIPKSGISTLWEDLWETENARYGTYRYGIFFRDTIA